MLQVVIPVPHGSFIFTISLLVGVLSAVQTLGDFKTPESLGWVPMAADSRRLCQRNTQRSGLANVTKLCALTLYYCFMH